MNPLTLLGLGFVLGLKHATDADHLVAVSTIVADRKSFWSSSIVGALWGLGHTASLLIVGLLVVAFQITIPASVSVWLEMGVAVMLVALGVNVLVKVVRGGTLHFHTHEHAGHVHTHPHVHEAGAPERHEHAVGKKPFFVGMVHGLAGSAALMLIVLATITSRTLGLLYIAVFGIGSVGGMFVMSALIGLPFHVASQHERLHRIIQAVAGGGSVCFGLFYAWQVGSEAGLFLSWTL